MKKWSQPFLIGVLMLVLWTSACNLTVQTPVPPSTTIIPTEQLGAPNPTGARLISVTETGTSVTPAIPITGENVVEMQCQLCVNSFAHAVFIFPDSVTFDVESGSPVTCLTAEVVHGKRVLICNGTQSTSFNLKICSDASNCLLFPVALQPCPLTGTGTQVTTVTPVFLTAINTLLPPSPTPRPRATVPSQAPTQTSIVPSPGISLTAPPSLPTSTPIAPPPATSTSAPPPANTSTSAPPPPPPPPTQPADTPASTSEPPGHRRPTHTPKP